MNERERLMSGYEQRIVRGIKKSKGDRHKDDQMILNITKRLMNQSVEVRDELGTGEVVSVSLGELVVAKRLAYDLEHPEKIDLGMYSKVLGENKDKVELELKGADALFGDIVIKEEKGKE